MHQRQSQDVPVIASSVRLSMAGSKCCTLAHRRKLGLPFAWRVQCSGTICYWV